MATISLDENANGQMIRVAANDVIEINLDETPTTGYKWEISELDRQHFQLLSEDYKLYGGDAMGGGGIKKIQLKSIGSGSGCVRLENKQPWSGDVYKTFEFNYQ
jgi:inhibitor of cysteine peptidase